MRGELRISSTVFAKRRIAADAARSTGTNAARTGTVTNTSTNTNTNAARTNTATARTATARTATARTAAPPSSRAHCRLLSHWCLGSAGLRFCQVERS